MPQIINPYKANAGMGEDLFGLGGIADAFFGPKASQSAFTREKFKEAQRQNQFTPLLAEKVGQLGLAGGNINQTMADAINAGVPINEIAAANQLGVTMNNKDNLSGNVVTAAALANRTPAASTMFGFGQDLANRQQTELGRTTRLIEAQRLKDESELVPIVDPASRTGYSTITRSKFNPAVHTRLESQDLLKSGQAGRLLFGEPGTASVAATSPDDMPITASARPAMTPDQRVYLGIDPKSQSGDNFYITNALGEIVDQGVTLDSGKTRIDGTPIVPGENKLGLASAANPTALSGLAASGPAAKEIRDSRIATLTATTQIDNAIRDLAKPNADAALGLVGQGAIMVNNLRSQIDAVTGTARELGYGAHADLFAKGADEYLAKNPGLLAWAQQRNIQSSVLKSQISSLGYVIARANNQGGTLGVRDVTDAMEEIGANLHDPKAFSAVLTNVKGRLEQQQAIRERVTAGTVQPQTARALKLNAPAPAVAPGAGAAPGGTTATGATWKVE